MAADAGFPRTSIGVTRTDHGGYGGLIAVKKKSIIFWVTTPCSLAKVHQCSPRKDHVYNI
jgi:hypothetical protein